jgi:hypothetical protein
MARVQYLKQEASSGPVSLEVQQNDNWVDETWAAILVQQHWKLEL